MRKLSTILLVAAVTTACSDTTAPEDVTVAVDDDFYSPSILTIDAGATVTFQWVGERVHDVVFAGGSIASPAQASGTFELTLDTPGGYSYSCTFHSEHRGEITVQ